MPQWIDTRSHGVALLARNSPDGTKELVLQRLRPDAPVPEVAIEFGFEPQPQGDVFIRKNTRFSLAEIRSIFPEAKVSEMAIEDIVYRVDAPFAGLGVPNPLSSARTAQEPLLPPTETVASPPTPPVHWARTPLSRFLVGARQAQKGGIAYVEFEEETFESGEDPKALHLIAVQTAVNAGVALPFAVLVDYGDLAYPAPPEAESRTREAAVRIRRSEVSVSTLLSVLGITEKLMEGDSKRAVLKFEGENDLVILRESSSHGQRLSLTQYHQKRGQQALESELVFDVRDGRLHLAETATENLLRGGEIRERDPILADAFSNTWLYAGFAVAEVHWADAPGPPPPGGVAEEVRIPLEPAAPTDTAKRVTTTFVLDHAGAAELTVGMSRGAALGDLLPLLAEPPAACKRRTPVGQNLFGMTILEDESGVRHLELRSDELTEDREERGLEFMTQGEGQRAGRLTLVQSEPIKGTLLFGRPVHRCLRLTDGSTAYFALQENSGEHFAYKLDFADGGRPEWQSMGAAWTHGAPGDGELLSARPRPLQEFDQQAFVRELNETIACATEDVLDERYRILPLDLDKITIRKISERAFEVMPAEVWVPSGPIRIEQSGDYWRATQGTSSSSLRCSLEAAFSWAHRSVATHREYYLAHLHQLADGALQFAIPDDTFQVLRSVLHKGSIGEQTSWSSMGVAGDWQIEPRDLRAEQTADGKLRIGVRGRELSYEICSMEADPASTVIFYRKEGLRRINQWLGQVQDDIRWDDIVREHRDGPLLQKRLRDYQDLQIQNYGGERHGARVPSAYSREMVLAITDRDVDRLIQVIRDNGPNNKSTMRLFQDVSGLKLGHSRATRAEAVYRYCGLSPEDAAGHAQSREALARVRALAREAKERIAAVENFMVSHHGVKKTGKAMLDEVWSQGFTELVSRRQGASTRYSIRNPSTMQYYDLKEPLTGYARHLITIRDSARRAPAPAEEPEDAPTPGI
ncbi:hypothetical protein QE400_000040 [Xanthomonas sacchari]|uniref:hypothetical protein n=1 Tax=Xanthomonas sacchari TaxID=56458 RepID=UPI002787984F|nr:hypothetical protein [Xanthomonas sacchari]MDQ1090627.1 hypothetical protein [Xanthomonas sacchari]